VHIEVLSCLVLSCLVLSCLVKAGRTSGSCRHAPSAQLGASCASNQWATRLASTICSSHSFVVGGKSCWHEHTAALLSIQGWPHFSRCMQACFAQLGTSYASRHWNPSLLASEPVALVARRLIACVLFYVRTPVITGVAVSFAGWLPFSGACRHACHFDT
jgi:hypothetical protein